MLHVVILPVLLMAYVDVLVLFLLFREGLIDKRIESAVSQMQSVIELGRVIRDRKTMPIKVSYQIYSTPVSELRSWHKKTVSNMSVEVLLILKL